MQNMIDSFWKTLKRWRKLNIGPVSLVFKFERKVTVTPHSKNKRNMVTLKSPTVENELNCEQKPVTKNNSSEIGGQPLPTAVIIGTGPGLGFALARELATAGFEVIVVSRDATHLDTLVDELREKGHYAMAYGCDATDESSVKNLFSLLNKNHNTPDLLIYAVQYFSPGTTIDVEPPAFEDAWRHNCFGAFLVAKAAAQPMIQRGHGTIVFVGSTSSLIGRENHLNLAVGKFGQRALAQVLARELWPKGIHIAHLVIDADVAEQDSCQTYGAQAAPEEIAQSVLAVHRQKKTAWTSELDIRPSNEQFWEHC